MKDGTLPVQSGRAQAQVSRASVFSLAHRRHVHTGKETECTCAIIVDRAIPQVLKNNIRL